MLCLLVNAIITRLGRSSDSIAPCSTDWKLCSPRTAGKPTLGLSFTVESVSTPRHS